MDVSQAPRAVVCESVAGHPGAMTQAVVRAGFEVTRTASSGQLRAAVLAGPPDVVVLDLALAGRAGLALVHELKVLSPRTAVVAVSPFASLREDALMAGAIALVDDADLRELERVVSALREPVPTARPSADERLAARRGTRART